MTRFSTLYRRPRLLLVALVLLAAALGHRAPFLAQDNSPDAFFGADREGREVYTAFKERFGRDEVVLLRWEGARFDDAEALRLLHALANEATQLEGVRDSLYPGKGLSVELQRGMIAAETRELPLYAALGLYRETPPSMGILLQVVMEGASARGQLAAQLERLRASYQSHADSPGALRIASLATANAAIDAEAQRTLGVFMPLLVLLAGLVGLLLFRSAAVLLPLLAPALAATVSTLGALELAGEPLNLISGVMPPVILAVSIAGSMHLITHYATVCRCATPMESVQCTIRDKLAPTLLAFVTTAIGFGSLALSEVEAIRVLGWSSALGLALGALFVVLGTPALLALHLPRLRMPSARQEIPTRLATWAVANRRWVLLLSLVTVLAIGLGALRLTPRFDGMELLPPDNEARSTFRALEAEGVGLGNLELWLQMPFSLEQLFSQRARLQALASELETVTHVRTVLGAHDVIGLAERRAGVLAPLLAQSAQAGGAATRPLVDALQGYWAGEHGVRLTLLSGTGDASTFAEQQRAVAAIVERHFPGQPWQLTGQFAMLSSTPGKLMQTMVQSLALTVGLIALTLLLVFRKWRWVGATVLSNLVPVAILLGVMGWLGVGIDIATVMTASVVLGIVVDDSQHWLHAYARTRQAASAAAAVSHGMVATSFVLASAFLVLALSGFDPVLRFAVGTSFAIVVALVVDLLVLPALLGDERVEKTAR